MMKSLLFLCFISAVAANFGDTTLITNGLQGPYTPSNVFYYNGLLHVTLDSDNLNSAVLIRYKSDFSTFDSMDLPNNCVESSCNLNFKGYTIKDNIAHFLVENSESFEVTSTIYVVDLDSFTMKSQSNPINDNMLTVSWIPYTDDYVFEFVENVIQSSTITGFNVTSQTPITSTTQPFPTNVFDAIGFPDLLTIVGCASNYDHVSNAFVLVDAYDLSITSTTGNMTECPFVTSLEGTALFVAAIPISILYGTALTIIDASQSLPSSLPMNNIFSKTSSPAVILSDSSNDGYVFLGSYTYAVPYHQNNGTVTQFKVSGGKKIVQVDQINIPSPYVPLAIHYTSQAGAGGVDTKNQQIAIICADNNSYNPNQNAIIVANYN